jgi:3-oxoacyl-[acyl-carrier-protein] synthase-3
VAFLAQRGIETSDAWIRERTGIQERRYVDPGDPAEHNSSLALAAARQALEMAGRTAAEIDQIVYATCSPDTRIPSSACWLQHKLGATRAWAMDINAACSGFIYGLATANQFIAGGQSRVALVVGAEVLSPYLNWQDRASCILFGDGAGAVVVEKNPSGSPRGILSSHLHSDGSLWELLNIPVGGTSLEATPERLAANLDKIQMNGREVFKIAVRTLAEYALEALTHNGMTPSDLDWFVPHQANRRIIEAVAKRLDLPMEKVIVNIERYANTSSATIPSALHEAVGDGRVRPGQIVLLDAFGAGLTYGSLLMRW